MVICDSSEQAKQMFHIFKDRFSSKVVEFKSHADKDAHDELPMVAGVTPTYTAQRMQANKVKSAALILHDVGNKEERKTGWKLLKLARLIFCLSTTCYSPGLMPSD